ncbi:hypothetical protein C8Q78DRAFT_346446 [Trametes maxima]|nr:hypothetical protein C8Q78DRAFT_346446 [Trametes maxima]
MNDNMPPSPACVPFNNSNADLILCTSDEVAFHVWRCILAEASPVFSDMFSLADRSSIDPLRAPPDGDAAPPAPTTPSLNIPESSTTLDTLLRLCYPTPRPPHMSLDSIKPVLHAAHKYQMDSVLDILKLRLGELTEDAPLRVYALAIQYDLADTARLAARKFLVRPWNPEDNVPELYDINAGAYQHLLAYRKRCSATLAEITTGLGWLPDDGWTFMQCSGCCPRLGLDDGSVPMCRLRGSDVDKKPAVWFWRYHDSMGRLLRGRPCAEALADPHLMNQALKRAARCGTCREVAYEQMVRFQHKLSQEVTRRLGEIKLDTRPSGSHSDADISSSAFILLLDSTVGNLRAS